MNRLFGLVGYPLGHSFSARYFAEKFAREGVQAEYRNFELPSIDLLPSVIKENEALCGFNVTIPYKREVLQYLDIVSDEAAEIGAVNCVKITRDGGALRLAGYNTDEMGFRLSLAPLLNKSEKYRALVLGTGGASGAVMCALRKLGVEATYVSRSRAEGVLSYADLTPETIAGHLLVVNCTPLGMHPNTEACPDLAYEAISEKHVLYDLVYNPATTLFMQRGAERGAVVKNGLEMLHLQADAAWEIWNNND